MKPQLLKTEDGSYTLSLEEMDETYHSTHGALTETRHVFIKNGFMQTHKKHINILEIGFGTGLNAIATLDAFLHQETIKSIHYTTLEKYPVEKNIYSKLNYGALFEPTLAPEFNTMHSSDWGNDIEITPDFIINKKCVDLLTEPLSGRFDLVYFDAFAPSKQAEMWQHDVIKKVTDCMTAGATLSTYCAQGAARRTLIACGLNVERVPGPPGKREMLVGVKTAV